MSGLPEMIKFKNFLEENFDMSCFNYIIGNSGGDLFDFCGGGEWCYPPAFVDKNGRTHLPLLKREDEIPKEYKKIEIDSTVFFSKEEMDFVPEHFFYDCYQPTDEGDMFFNVLKDYPKPEDYDFAVLCCEPV